MNLVILVVSLAILLYLVIGYPLLIALYASLRPVPVARLQESFQVSVVLVVCNEAECIKEKLESLLGLFEADRIQEILVGSDGSTDETNALVKSIADPRVRLVAWDDRRGKASVLNDLVAEAKAEILVFTDARQRILEGSLQALLAGFADPKVGVVSGEMVFDPESQCTPAGQGMGMYWAYETWIRRNESAVHSVPGATGAWYALRKPLYQPISADTLVDDVVIPLQAVVVGSRCILETDARIVDWASHTVAEESVRKRRTLTGCFQLIQRHPAWLLPHCNPIWWQFVSHKILRLASPWLLVLCFLSAWTLRGEPVGILALLGQGICYGLALAGWILGRFRLVSLPTSICLTFFVMNLATALALADFLFERSLPAWRMSQKG